MIVVDRDGMHIEAVQNFPPDLNGFPVHYQHGSTIVLQASSHGKDSAVDEVDPPIVPVLQLVQYGRVEDEKGKHATVVLQRPVQSMVVMEA